MDIFTADYVANLTADLTMALLAAAKRRTREALTGGPAQEALTRCTRAGLTALLAAAAPAGEEDAVLLGDLFEAFFAEADTAHALAELLRGDRLDLDELRYVFNAVGYDAETLPGLPFERAVRVFEAAFVQQVADEPALRETLVATQTLAQTGIQQALLETVQGLLAFLRAHWEDQVGIRADTIIAQNVVNGVQATYQMAPVHVAAPLPDWEAHYLATLIARCDPLDLTPIDETQPQPGAVGQTTAVTISDVFTTLYLDGVTRAPDQPVAEAVLRREALQRSARQPEQEPQPVAALEAAGALARLIILGHPGGGKSTLLHYLVTQLARRRQGETAPLPGWPDDAHPLPVLVVLRRFAAWLPAESTGTAGDVWNYLEAEMETLGCREFFPALKQVLVEEGGVVCFDGLDEVGVAEAEARRAVLVRAIVAFARPLTHCRVLVTCRDYAYRENDGWRLPAREFPVVRLALFEVPQIEAFAQAWYRQVGPRKGWPIPRCEREAAHLVESVRALPHLRELAQYPLLLTLMAQVHGRDGTLPDDRADLYERAVNLLLAHWENRLVRDVRGECTVEPGLVTRLGVPLTTLRAALETVALDAHIRQEQQAQRSERAADIPKEDLREALRADLGSLDRAEEVITYVQERAGLLQALDHRTYAFPHRTFQEYLAARAALRRGDFDVWLSACVRRDLAWWREVFLLAAGSARAVPSSIANLVDTLFLGAPDGQEVTAQRVPWATLAAQVLVETHFATYVQRETPPGRYAGIYIRLQTWLCTALQAAATLQAPDRARAGEALARLDDPRPEVMTVEGMAFCYVPGGPFWMGEGDVQHLNTHVDSGYWLARYPVTVAQWQLYVQQSGVQPGDADSLRGTHNAPVVRVSWHEALRFCEWLTEAARHAGWLPDDWRLTLPSEAEWEKAARGGVQQPAQALRRALQAGLGPVEDVTLTDNPEPQRTYPWGDRPDPNRANYDKSGIGRTSAVSCFPGGASVYEIEDLSGNVWEWTRSIYQDYPYNPKDWTLDNTK